MPFVIITTSYFQLERKKSQMHSTIMNVET